MAVRSVAQAAGCVVKKNQVAKIAQSIAALDPWCHSTEGLDDGCHFCGSDRGNPQWSSTEPPGLFVHEPWCSWLALRESLGLGLVLEIGSPPYIMVSIHRRGVLKPELRQS